MSLERIQLVGNVGQDPIDHTAKVGKPFVTFSLACTSRYEDRDFTSWYHIHCNGKKAQYVIDNIRKGDSVFVEGKPKPNGHTNADNELKVEIQVNAKYLHISSKSKIINSDPDTVSE